MASSNFNQTDAIIVGSPELEGTRFLSIEDAMRLIIETAPSEPATATMHNLTQGWTREVQYASQRSTIIEMVRDGDVAIVATPNGWVAINPFGHVIFEHELVAVG